MGKRLTQRRRDTNDRKAISNVRIFMKIYIMNLIEEPFHEFEDGLGIKFIVNDKIGRNQVNTLEEEEFAAMADDDSPFTYRDDIGPSAMAGFSFRYS